MHALASRVSREKFYLLWRAQRATDSRLREQANDLLQSVRVALDGGFFACQECCMFVLVSS